MFLAGFGSGVVIEGFILVSFTTLISIVNPVGALGPFLAMTVGDSEAQRKEVAKKSAIVAAMILAFCGAVGGFVFKFYGITIPALKIAGGVLLFFVAIDMLNARQSRSKQTAEEQNEGALKPDIAVFPLAMPLLSGPGSIASVFMLMDKADTWQREVSVYVGIAMVGILSWLMLREAHRIVRLLGQIGINLLSRLMGLMLAAIACQFIIDGLKLALPGLAH